MNVESSFDYLTRSLEKAYRQAKYDKKVKLTEKSDKNIRTRAIKKLNSLHDKKWEYKHYIDELDEKLKSIREKLTDKNINDLERAQLKLEFQETRLERDKEVKLLPRKMNKIKKKMSKTITNARKDIRKNEEKRPIKISEISIGKFKKLIARFETIHNFFSKDINVVDDSKSLNDAHVSLENLEAASEKLNVESINPEEIQKSINESLERAEQAYTENHVKEEEQSTIATTQQVSDFIDKQLADFSQSQTNQFQHVDNESELSTVDEDKVVSQKFTSQSDSLASTTNDNLDSMFGINQTEQQSREEVEIPESRIVSTPIEDEISFTSESGQDTIESYGEKLDGLKNDFTDAANLGDIAKLKEIKTNMINVVNSINALKTKEKNNFDIAKEQEEMAKKEEQEAKIEVINGLTSDIKSLMTNGDDSINYASSLQQQTSATLARTKEIKASIDILRSEQIKQQENNRQLEEMINDSAEFNQEPTRTATISNK